MDFILIATIILVSIQFVYLITLLFAHFGNQTKPNNDPQPVSVIVCAHDEEENLKELIPQLLIQDHPDFELIIVEDRGNDDTYDFLMEAAKKDTRLKVVRVVKTPEHVNEKKFALTLGIKAAKHDWILLTDADCRPASNDWISSMSKNFSSRINFVLGYSSYEHQSSLLNSFIRFETLLTGILYTGFSRLGRPYMGVGRNLAYRKSMFLENKGFNKILKLTGGDDDLFVNRHAHRKNTITSLGKEVLVTSKPKKSWKEFYFQKLRHLSAGKKYKFVDKLLLGAFFGSWVFWWIALPISLFTSFMTIASGLIIFRWILVMILYNRASRTLGDSFEWWKIPFLDIIYAFYYLVVGAQALRIKKVRWKN